MPTTSNFGWTTPADTDLVKDGAAAIRTLGNGVDASFIDLKGGTTGQVLSKASNTDLDFTWTAGGDITEVQAGTGISVASGTGPIPVVTNSMATEITAKGDLIVGTGSGTFDNLAVGTNGHILTADSSVSPTGLKWAAPAAGGKLLQVINAETATSASSTSTTYVDTNLTASITPSSTASKVLVTVHQSYKTNANGNGMGIKLFRGATELKAHGGLIANSSAAGEIIFAHFSISYLDSPNTTSATTYKTQFSRQNGIATVTVNPDSIISYITLMEIGA